MVTKGWLVDGGKLDIGRLARATGVRWQTAQGWTGGSDPHAADLDALNKKRPKDESLEAIAKALDVTVDELIDRAMGAEPATQEWLDFKRTSRMTRAEMAAVLALPWPHGPPDVAAYRIVLNALRSAGQNPE